MPAPPLPIHPHLLPYVQQLQPRGLDSIDLVVLHCTELPDLTMARDYGERIQYPQSGTGNSGHFYIDRDGTIHQYVPLDRIAHHVRGHNATSIGIELVNRGRWPHWLDSRHQAMSEPYPDTQMAALLGLLAWLRGQVAGLGRIAGHEDLDTERVPASDDATRLVQRKRDPGPLFPWPQVLAAGGWRRLQPTPASPAA